MVAGIKNLRYLLLKAKRMAVTNVEFIAVHTVKKAGLKWPIHRILAQCR